MVKPTQLPSGAWRVQPMINGTRYNGTFETEKEALAWAKDLKDEARRAKQYARRPGRMKSVSDAIDRYHADHPTAEKWQCARREWWREHMGRMRLGKIADTDIADALDKFQKGGRGPATTNRMHAAISVVFKHCMHPRVKWLRSNPAQDVPRLEEPKGRTRWLRDSERDALLAACEKCVWPGFPVLIRLALATGARKSELLTLTWLNVNLNVNLSKGSVYFEETKNGEPRLVPIGGQTLEALREWGRIRNLHSPLVFPGRRHVDRPASIQKYWESAIREAGLKNFVFHDLRHSAGSYLAQAGLSTTEIMETLGHKTMAMSARYSHLSDSHHDRVRAAMEKRLG